MAGNPCAISAVECTQKLDLLVHIIINLQNCLILKGKRGIGKSTFLKTVLTRKINKHELYLIKANHEMSFETVQSELLRIISTSYQLDMHNSIAEVLDIYAQEGKSLVLLIDDAGCLVSGLLSTLITYADQYKALRLVFTLTPSEYDEKQKIEKIESNCQVMSLSGLTLKQTELLICQLVMSGNSPYTMKEVDVAFIKKIYNITLGNPREISQLILSTEKNTLNNLSVFMGVILMVVIFLIVMNRYLLSEPEQVSKKELMTHIKVVTEQNVPDPVAQDTLKQVHKIKSMTFEQETTDILNLKHSTLPIKEEIKSSSVTMSSILEKKKRIEEQDESLPIVKAGNKFEKVTLTRPVVKVTKLDESNKIKSHSSPESGDSYQWILSKKGSNYTLQLMVLSTKKKLLAVQKKYLKLGYKTFYITKNAKKSLSYILFYGDFQTLSEAKMQVKKLPKELRKAWPRKISIIQREIQSNS